MRLDKLVAHCDDIVDGELCGGVRLEHCRLVYVLALAGYCRLDCDELGVDVSHIHSRELYGESADVGRVYSAAVNEAGYLYARICGEVVDKTRVEHVAADLIGRVGDDSLHNV